MNILFFLKGSLLFNTLIKYVSRTFYYKIHVCLTELILGMKLILHRIVFTFTILAYVLNNKIN
jgi:hypothetical protein